jgi:hypothetical protein
MVSSRVIRTETIGVNAKAELQEPTALVSRESRQLALAERARREVDACRRGVEMTSAATPHPGCPTTVIPNLPEAALAERLSIRRALCHDPDPPWVVPGGTTSQTEPCRLCRYACCSIDI